MSEGTRMISQASLYSLGNISQQLVGFLMLPIYTRFLSPEDYGAIGLATMLLALTEALFGARLGQGVPKFYFERKGDSARHAVLSTAVIITLIASVLATLAVFSGRGPIGSALFGTTDYDALLAVFSFTIITTALESYGLLYIRMLQKPVWFISVTLVKLVVQLSLNILFVVVWDWGVMGIAWSAIISSSLFALGLTVFLVVRVGLHFEREAAIKLLSFTWPLWIAGLTALYIRAADNYFIRLFDDLAGVGLYALAMKFGTIITSLIWQPFQQYWVTERFEVHHRGDADWIFPMVFNGMLTVVVLAALGISLLSVPVIQIMADPAFWEAAQAVPFLCLVGVFNAIGINAQFALQVTENTRYMPRITFSTAVISTVLYLALIPPLGFLGAAIALSIAQLAQCVSIISVGSRFYNMHIHYGRIALGILLTGSALALFEWLGPDAKNPWLDGLIRLGAFVVIGSIPVIILMMKDDMRAFVFKTLRRIANRVSNTPTAE